MAIIAVPQLSDNYAYLVVDDASKECGVVDCAEADKVLAEVKQQGLKLVAVLPTHWHFDHVGGYVGNCQRWAPVAAQADFAVSVRTRPQVGFALSPIFRAAARPAHQ